MVLTLRVRQQFAKAKLSQTAKERGAFPWT
jgi:hypothetical protein